MPDRILGLVGGLGPESTIDYYRRLVDAYHAQAGPDSHPRIIVNSLDGGPLIGPMVAGDVGPMRAAVGRAVEQLAAAGAGIALIGSVATHVVYADVAERAPIPMLSIVDETCAAAVARGIRRPAIFGTKVATEGVYFGRPFEAAGIDLVRGTAADRTWIHDVYLRELVRGSFLQPTRARLLDILARLRREEGADALILAGTELSLLLPEGEYDGVPVLNAAAIHVAAAVRWLLGGDLSSSSMPA